MQPRALAGIVGLHQLKVINSKIDRVVSAVVAGDTRVGHTTLDGNHLLAIPDTFDFKVIDLKISANKIHCCLLLLPAEPERGGAGRC